MTSDVSNPQNQLIMNYEETNKQRYDKLVNIAIEHVTGKGLRTGYKWLLDEFWDYFKWHEEAVEAGHLISFGGMSGGTHNARVLGMMIARSVHDVVPMDEQQFFKMSDTLSDVATNKQPQPWRKM